MKRVLMMALRSSPKSDLGHVPLPEQLFWAIFLLSLYLGPLTTWTEFTSLKEVQPCKWPFTSVKLFLAQTPTFQDLYKQPGCSYEHSCMGLSGRKNFCNKSAFYSAAFQAGRHYNRQWTSREGVCIFSDSCKLWNNSKKKRSEVELSDKKNLIRTAKAYLSALDIIWNLKKKISSVFKIQPCGILQHSINYFHAVPLSLHH